MSLATWDPFLGGVGAFNWVSVSDMISMLAFAVVLGLVLALPLGPRARAIRVVKWLGVVLMSLYLFVGLSNTLQWTNVTSVLDPYEDYAKILFVPTIAYIVYALAAAQRLDLSRQAEKSLRQQHDLLESIVETSPTGIMVVEPDGLVSFANDRARELLELESVDGAGRYTVGESVQMGSEPGQRRAAAEVLGEFAERGRAQGVTRFVERPGERTVAIEISAKPLSEKGGSVLAFVDVTDRMRYRRDLERAVDMRTHELLEVNEELLRANSAKQDFLAKMSHELRTPLNSVIGFAGVLMSGQAGALTEEQLRQLKMVRRSGEHLLQLVNDVLDMSVMGADKMRISYGAVDVCEFVESAVGTMRPMAVDHGVELSHECSAEVCDAVTDEDKLGQVLRNLLSNAIKFTDSGGRVSVRVEVAGERLVLRVADTGIGIAPEEMDRVFEPFQQVDTHDRARPAGTGLGLAICRDLVKLLGGDMSVESELGVGSTFTVSIPRSPDDRECAPE